MRKRYMNEVKEILLRLKNSLGNLTEKRIRKVEEALNEFVEEDRIERLLESFKVLQKAYEEHSSLRHKKLERGAENLANLLMKMRFEKASYESFIVEVMKLDGNIRWEVNLHL